MSEHLRIVVAIATTGRAAVLFETLRGLRDQARTADAIVICPADPADVDRDAVATLGLPVSFVVGSRGASAARSATSARLASSQCPSSITIAAWAVTAPSHPAWGRPGRNRSALKAVSVRCH